MFYLILNLFFSLLTIVMTGVMLFAFRKPRRITFFSSLLSVLISFLIPVIFLVLTGAKPDLKLMLPFFKYNEFIHPERSGVGCFIHQHWNPGGVLWDPGCSPFGTLAGGS